MIRISEVLRTPADADASLTLAYEARQRSRLRTRLDSGEAAGLFLPRGTVLRGGDLLRADNGMVVAVRAAPEAVSTIENADPLRLARACYHLGNRHVPLEIGAGRVRYLRDHVLDHLLESMGLPVRHEEAPFEPESGAYHHHG
jgi:urease accessory protein